MGGGASSARQPGGGVWVSRLLAARHHKRGGIGSDALLNYSRNRIRGRHENWITDSRGRVSEQSAEPRQRKAWVRQENYGRQGTLNIIRRSASASIRPVSILRNSSNNTPGWAAQRFETGAKLPADSWPGSAVAHEARYCLDEYGNVVNVFPPPPDSSGATPRRPRENARPTPSPRVRLSRLRAESHGPRPGTVHRARPTSKWPVNADSEPLGQGESKAVRFSLVPETITIRRRKSRRENNFRPVFLPGRMSPS